MWKLRILNAKDFPAIATSGAKEDGLAGAIIEAMEAYNRIANYYNTKILGFATPASDAYYRAKAFSLKEKVEVLYRSAEVYLFCEE